MRAQLGAGWAPMTAPPAPATHTQLLLKVCREVIIFGVLIIAATKFGVLTSPLGWLSIPLGRAVLGLLNSHRASRTLGRTVVEYAAVAALAFAVAVAAAPQPPAKKATPPARVEASQVDYLEQARTGVANLYEQIATGFSQATTKEGGG